MRIVSLKVFSSSDGAKDELNKQKKNPKIKEEHCEELENDIKNVNKTNTCINGGGQNAKTGLRRKEFPEVV